MSDFKLALPEGACEATFVVRRQTAALLGMEVDRLLATLPPNLHVSVEPAMPDLQEIYSIDNRDPLRVSIGPWMAVIRIEKRGRQ